MMGMHFMGEVPFHTVYIHALVRDASGQKMSKSKGNVIDPLVLVDKYGADALRFTLSAMAAQGRDIKLAESRVEGYRNFGTKLWNACRFAEMNGVRPDPSFDPGACKEILNRWIVGKVETAAAGVSAGIESYRFNDAAQGLYQFVWGSFCDWYVELSKPVLSGDDAAAAAETRACTAWVIDRILRLLHPFMPFLTEELWAQFGGDAGRLLIEAEWPESAGLLDAGAEAEVDWVIRLISEIRAVRAEMNIPGGTKVPAVLHGAGDQTEALAARWRESAERLARLESLTVDAGPVPAGAVQIPLEEAVIALPVADVIDVSAERGRLEKEIARVDAEIDKMKKKLASENFVSRAPVEVVEEQRERLTDAEGMRGKLGDALRRLAAI
ncbi:MAG: class I tRNA ligase family protein, partial [Acetobacterales bacterium]